MSNDGSNGLRRYLAGSAAFGLSFALTLALTVYSVKTYLPLVPHWKNQEISAEFADVEGQRAGNEVNVNFTFALRNNSSVDYELPGNSSGELMLLRRNVPGYRNADATWDRVVIPPGEQFAVRFVVPISLASEKWTAKKYDRNPQMFLKNQLAEIQELAFFDSKNHRKIVLPRGW